MNVLIVGYGSIAKKHVNALNQLDRDFNIYALRSNKEAKEIEGIINIFELDAFKDKFDFAIISNPSNLHVQTIKDLLPLKCPLFIEKPSVHELGGVDDLLALVNEAGVSTYIGCNLRFLECLSFFKDKVNEIGLSQINEVNVYAGSYLPDWRPGTDYLKSYSANADMGGGAHLDLIHELDYVYWFFGNPISSKKTLRNKSSIGIKAVDYANYLFEYETFEANVILNYYRKKAKRSIELLYGEHILYVDLLKNTVSLDDELIFESSGIILDTYKKQLDYFIHNCVENQSSFNTLEDSINVMKMCLND